MPAPISLQLGMQYKTRGGYQVTVKKLERDATYPCLCEVLVAEGGAKLAVYYTEEGRAGVVSYFYDVESAWTGWT